MVLKQNIQYIKNTIKERREDGRDYQQYRPISIETGTIQRAEGSARVRIGNSDVIAGVKMDIGQPFPDSPREGVLMVNAELSALASPEFENGPPSETAIELARVVDRGIRESNTLDVEKLCIEEGEKVWMVFVDINIVNHDGNLIDAAGIAAIAALMTAQVPKIEDDGSVNRDYEFTGKLPIVDTPVPVTTGLIDGILVTDMNKLEEESADCKMILTTNKKKEYCAMQKSGPEALTDEQMLEMGKISIKKGAEIRKMVEDAVKKHGKS